LRTRSRRSCSSRESRESLQEATAALRYNAPEARRRRDAAAVHLRHDIRNDTAVALADLGRRDEARELLAGNARADRNRVELAKALTNLGVVNHRDGQYDEAAGQLSEAAVLDEAVGDYASAADTWSLLCNTNALLDRLDDARSAAHAAAAAAMREPTPRAVGRSLDARALLLGLDGDHAAAALALRAADGQEGVHRLESLAHAAEEHARADDWSAFPQGPGPARRRGARGRGP